MVRVSIFDLLQTTDNPKAKDLQRWIASVFTKSNDRISFQLAIQLEKLFEMAIFENDVDTVHLLLQQGLSPDIRGDWGTTPLMWSECLNHAKISILLKAYGADQLAKSFSGKTAKDLKTKQNQNSPEYQSILTRATQIHAQVKAGYLKPLSSGSAVSGGTTRNAPRSHQRQIDNGKGVDELFKKIKRSSRTQRKINFIIE